MAFLLVRVAFLALQYWICCLLQKEKPRLVVYLELRMEQIIVDRWDLVPGGCIASFEKTNQYKQYKYSSDCDISE